MEARDTVTKTTEENCHNTLEERLLEQAEIAFKAGERQGYDKGVIDRLREIDALIARLKTEKKAGIKKVVECIENNALRATYMADPTKECWGISDYELVKLKELGADNELQD